MARIPRGIIMTAVTATVINPAGIIMMRVVVDVTAAAVVGMEVRGSLAS